MSSTSLLEQFDRRKDFEEKGILKDITSPFTVRNKRAFIIPPPGTNVILLLSGGLDSISLWFLLLHKYSLNVYPLYCYRKGKEPDNQLKSIDFFDLYFKKRFPKLHHKYTKKVLAESFSFRDKDIHGKASFPLILPNLSHTKSDDIRAAIINTPTRIFDYMSQAISLLLNLTYEKHTDIKTIFIGYVPEDGIITRESTETVLRSINLTLSLILGDFAYQIMDPLDRKNNFYYQKRDLIRYAIQNNVPLERTWSCLKNGPIHCGACPSCRMRKEAFKKSRLLDRTKYVLIIKNAPQLVSSFLNKTSKKIQGTFQLRMRNKKQIILLPDSRFRLNTNTEWENVQGLIYRFNKDSGRLDSLNDSAAFVWKNIDQYPSITLKKLLFLLEKEYPGVKSSQLLLDLTRFLEDAIKGTYILHANKDK